MLVCGLASSAINWQDGEACTTNNALHMMLGSAPDSPLSWAATHEHEQRTGPWDKPCSTGQDVGHGVDDRTQNRPWEMGQAMGGGTCHTREHIQRPDIIRGSARFQQSRNPVIAFQQSRIPVSRIPQSRIPAEPELGCPEVAFPGIWLPRIRLSRNSDSRYSAFPEFSFPGIRLCGTRLS